MQVLEQGLGLDCNEDWIMIWICPEATTAQQRQCLGSSTTNGETRAVSWIMCETAHSEWTKLLVTWSFGVCRDSSTQVDSLDAQ